MEVGSVGDKTQLPATRMCTARTSGQERAARMTAKTRESVHAQRNVCRQ